MSERGGQARLRREPTAFRRGVDRCEVEVTCSNGMLTFDSHADWLSVDLNGAYAPRAIAPADAMAEESRNLVAAIRRREPLGVTLVRGRHIVDLLLAREESGRTGREVQIRTGGEPARTSVG